MRSRKKKLMLAPGDIYEACSFQPVLCIEVDYTNDDIWGISLIDGTYPHCCSLLHCGVRKLTIEEAWKIKTEGPLDPEDRERIAPDDRWWSPKLAQE